MKLMLGFAVFAALVCAVAGRPGAAERPAKRNPNLGKLRHVVLVQFKEGTAAKDVKRIEEEFGKLPSKIPTIVDFEWGTNNSPEGLADGFTHCFLVTFNDAKGRDVYLPHEAHKAFVSVLRPHLEKVLVIDYVAKD